MRSTLSGGEAAMSDPRTELGFERTVCDCSACKINCKFIPGFMLPSDIRRIAEHLGYSDPVGFALDNLLASPGGIVMDHGQIRRIRTLTPARRKDGACKLFGIRIGPCGANVFPT